jgi:AmiR/NasT family two-component response regulator
MLRRGLNADEAYELMRAGAEECGGDLSSVASDVIDLGTGRLPR